MKKLIAFIGSLLMVAPAIAQDSKTPQNNKPGVSKVQQKDVKATPAQGSRAATHDIKMTSKNAAIKTPASTNLKNSDKTNLKNAGRTNLKNAANAPK